MGKSILADADMRTVHIGRYRYACKENKGKFNNVQLGGKT